MTASESRRRGGGEWGTNPSAGFSRMQRGVTSGKGAIQKRVGEKKMSQEA